MQKVRPFQKRLLIIFAVLIIAVCLAPNITVINFDYPALHCTDTAYDSGTEEFDTVILRVHGVYLSTPIGHDRYYGTFHILDFPHEGKNSGGMFEPLELTELFDSGTQHGSLWYYSEKRNRYDSLGMIFWDITADQLYIHDEEDYFVYPANSVAEAQELWKALTEH